MTVVDFDPISIQRALMMTGADQERLFAAAREARDDAFGPQVVLRGVIETTNVCRVNCHYCPMRRDNHKLIDRFFLDANQILERSRVIREAGINIVFLQGGETPRVLKDLDVAIPGIRAQFGNEVEVLLNLGSFSGEQYSQLRVLGADSYILKHETGDSDLHAVMREESLADRLEHLRSLRAAGFQVGSGIISGLPGQSFHSMVEDILHVASLDVQMFSVSPFVPAPDTPLANFPPGSVDVALNMIAVLRLLYPNLLIPSVSALEKNGEDGQLKGLLAGANVMTVNFSDAQTTDRYLIYGENRYVVRLQHAQDVIRRANLKAVGSTLLTKQ